MAGLPVRPLCSKLAQAFASCVLSSPKRASRLLRRAQGHGAVLGGGPVGLRAAGHRVRQLARAGSAFG